MTDAKRVRAAVVFFVDSETVPAQDMANIMRQALYRNGTLHEGLSATAGGIKHHIRIVEVMDAGLAAGNGYLWTEATSKAWQYHEHGLDEKGLRKN